MIPWVKKFSEFQAKWSNKTETDPNNNAASTMNWLARKFGRFSEIVSIGTQTIQILRTNIDEHLKKSEVFQQQAKETKKKFKNLDDDISEKTKEFNTAFSEFKEANKLIENQWLQDCLKDQAKKMRPDGTASRDVTPAAEFWTCGDKELGDMVKRRTKQKEAVYATKNKLTAIAKRPEMKDYVRQTGAQVEDFVNYLEQGWPIALIKLRKDYKIRVMKICQLVEEEEKDSAVAKIKDWWHRNKDKPAEFQMKSYISRGLIP